MSRPDLAAIDLPSTGALLLVDLAGALTLGRLFTTTQPLRPIVLTCLAVHLICVAVRAFRGPIEVAFVGCAAAIAIIGTHACFASTAIDFGLPGRDTLAATRSALVSGWRMFQTERAPVPALPGLTLAAIIAVGGFAFMADSFALRGGLSTEAVLPSGIAVIFVGALTETRYRLPTTAGYIGAVALYAVMVVREERIDRLAGRSVRRAVASRRVLAGIGIGTIAVISAVVVTPAVQDVSERGLSAWRDGGPRRQPSRVALSPLVSLRPRLVEQSNREMFQVRARQPRYWRQTSLERFDGFEWSASGSYSRVTDRLPDDPGSGASLAGTTIEQQVTISGLESDWLPAAFRPVRISGAGGLRFDRSTASLLAAGKTKRGLVYTVLSESTDLSSTTLARGAGDEDGASVSPDALALPKRFPDRVRRLAHEVTAGASSTPDQARALQDFFRANFTYDLSVPPPSGLDDLQAFLFERRSGYCEQFAGAFAAMARAIGIPSRVAVGFAPGRLVDSEFVVAGRDAHAWPEVYIDGIGWVAYEPTPSRAIPGAEGYTGVPYQPSIPDQTGPGTPTTTTTPSAQVTPTTNAAAATTTTVPTARALDPQDRSHFPWTWLLSAVGIGALASSPAAIRTWRRRRRETLVRRGTLDLAGAAWLGAGDELSWLGLHQERAETAPRFALRAAAALEASGAGSGEGRGSDSENRRDTRNADALAALERAGAELVAVAAQLELATFGPPVDSASADRPTTTALREVVRAQIGVRRRLRRTFDPRLRKPPARRRKHHRTSVADGHGEDGHGEDDPAGDARG